MRKLLYSLCIAGFLASCNNEAKNKEAQDADMAKVTAAVETMKTTKMEESAAACAEKVLAAAQAKVDSINALPKAAQATAKKAVAKKKVAAKPAVTTPTPTGRTVDTKIEGKPAGRGEETKMEGKPTGRGN